MVQQSAKTRKDPILSRKTKASASGEPAAVGSLSRGLQIVDVLTSAQGCLTLSEVAALTGLDASTTLRLLHALSEHGYVVRDDSAKRYMAGPRALSPLSLFHPLTLFRREAEQVLRSLQQNTGETCALVLFLGNERLVVDFIRGRQPLSPYYDTWLKSPLHGSASGKILLAWLSDAEREQLLGAGPYMAHTPKTVTDPVIFKDRLEEICRQGYAVARDDAYQNLVAIGVPLMMPTHSRPMGCLVVTCTSQLLPEDAEADIVSSLKAAAALLINSSPSLQVLRHWTPRGAQRQVRASSDRT
ncbi:IclR family transcriptional regulator [Polaromonas sp. C04]|uniref:IclR family transcriptional regulator n=1 Tax=Polaromonas sp. C04 TaxID=1945857 RepID=UPI000985352D|nr:IclR family transcriptional regulator [Polaromonas sp. C04]